jgi:hypothetical protein
MNPRLPLPMLSARFLLMPTVARLSIGVRREADRLGSPLQSDDGDA